MVLSGVGGNTIAEAKERVSYTEYAAWVAYRRKRGSFNTGRRVDRAIGLLAALYANSKSKNGGFKMYDFTPYDEEPAIDIQDAMKQWS